MYTMIYSQVIFVCALFSLGYGDCPLKGRIFSDNTNVRAEPEFLALRDCKAWRELGMKQSGIYPVKPDFGKTFQVYCDMETNGGGWTVFQRRMDGSIDFYRTMADYKQGFGNLTGEFWLGLDKIHRLTTTNPKAGHSLRIELRDFGNIHRYAQYSSFSIGDEWSKYTLSVSGYSGTAGDSLAGHNGKKFTTKDHDNDNWKGNCAVDFTGAWWYSSCHNSNLNGQYLVNSKDHKGIQWWKTWKMGTLKFTEMKSRQN